MRNLIETKLKLQSFSHGKPDFTAHSIFFLGFLVVNNKVPCCSGTIAFPFCNYYDIGTGYVSEVTKLVFYVYHCIKWASKQGPYNNLWEL